MKQAMPVSPETRSMRNLKPSLRTVVVSIYGLTAMRRYFRETKLVLNSLGVHVCMERVFSRRAFLGAGVGFASVPRLGSSVAGYSRTSSEPLAPGMAWSRTIYNSSSVTAATATAVGDEFLLALSGVSAGENPRIACIDYSGDIRWDREYRTGGIDFDALLELSDGGYIVAGSVVVGLSPDGEVRWRYDDLTPEGSAAVAELEDGRAVVADNVWTSGEYRTRIIALDPDDGAVEWRTEVLEGTGSVVALVPWRDRALGDVPRGGFYSIARRHVRDSDEHGGRVRAFGPDGAVAGVGELDADPHDAMLSDSGHLWIAQSNGGSPWILALDRVGTNDSTSSGLEYPWYRSLDVPVDIDAVLEPNDHRTLVVGETRRPHGYATETVVFQLGPTGERLRSFYPRGTGDTVETALPWSGGALVVGSTRPGAGKSARGWVAAIRDVETEIVDPPPATRLSSNEESDRDDGERAGADDVSGDRLDGLGVTTALAGLGLGTVARRLRDG
ncbi:PQQ-binding-like beta-propeller repeat protein [Natronoarchaeum mannanilyticum]